MPGLGSNLRFAPRLASSRSLNRLRGAFRTPPSACRTGSLTVAQKVEHSSGIANSREHVDGVGVLGNHHESHIGNPHAWRCSHVHMLSRFPLVNAQSAHPGHVHEASRLTGEWKIRIGRTVCINAAYEGPKLALVRFALESPWEATRELL